MKIPKRKRIATAEKSIQEARDKKLTSLDLSNLGLTTFPSSLATLDHLESLDLSGNNLLRLPVTLAFPHLKTLILNDNHLISVPDWVGQCLNLQSLALHNNHIVEFPENFAELQNLRHLSLDRNFLRTVPAFLQNLTQLTRLSLDTNFLTHLPDWLAQLPLEHLSLRENFFLEDLPDSLLQLKNLQSLSLRGSPKIVLPKRLLDAECNSTSPDLTPMAVLAEYFQYQATVNRLKRIWVPMNETASEFKVAEKSTHGFEHLSGSIELQKSVHIYFGEGNAFFIVEEPNLSKTKNANGFISDRPIGALICWIHTGAIHFRLDSKIPAQEESDRQTLNNWLPFFRRNCWLSGARIECTAHERLEWIQGFTQQEIEAWNLQL